MTILIVTYNHEKFIGQCLEAVLKQTYGNLEILVLDDSSTDGTKQLMGRYCDPRIRYLHRPENLGLVRNYNSGLQYAKGDLIWGVAGDDYLLSSDEVAKRVEEFERDPCVGVVFGRPQSNSAKHAGYFDWGSSRKTMRGTEMARACVGCNPICAGGVMARSQLYRDFGVFPASLLYVGDWYFWFRFALESKKVVYLPEHCVFYRYHDANLSTAFAGPRRTDALVQQIQLRLAMLELTEGIDGFKEPIMAALRRSVRDLLDFWMNHPKARDEVRSQLGRRWELDEVPRTGLDLSKLMSDVFVEQARGTISAALHQRRPIYFLRALQLQAALPGVKRCLSQSGR